MSDSEPEARPTENIRRPGASPLRADISRYDLPKLRVSDLQGLAVQLGIPSTARMRKRDLVAAIQERQVRPTPTADDEWHSTAKQEVLDLIYQSDQGLVASSIIAMRRAAAEMLGDGARGMDLFGAEGAQRLGAQWDVFQNYAEQDFPDSHPIFGSQIYSREIIDASFDPAWRLALREWETQNQELIIDTEYEPIPMFEYAAELDLGSYVSAFNESTQTLGSVLNAGRLPFHPLLVARSTQLAKVIACLWRLVSIDSPMHRQLVAVHSDIQGEPYDEHEDSPQPQAGLPLAPRPSGERLHAQAEGERLERSVMDIFESLFRVDDSDARRLRTELRRQRSGTQFGADIIFRFRATALSSSSTCLVECKSYTSPLTVGMVAEKLMQAEASFDAEPLDHWILVSPYEDPNNELDRMVQRWNSEQRFPFTVQIWSPQSSVHDFFAIEPNVYHELYGEDPVASNIEVDRVISEFSARLQPPLRLSRKLAEYITDPLSFTQPNERIWLDHLDTQIERYGLDKQGARLPQPLEKEVLSVLCDASHTSNVVLLLAEFGEGKSFFTVSLCAHLQARYLAEPRAGGLIPVRLLLRGFRHVASPLDFLRGQLELIGLGMEEWAELRRLNVLVVLDGLDEMSVRQDPETTRSNLEKIGSLLELLEGLPVLATSRPHFFSSAPDRERFYDRLRTPHVFRMAQPDRRDTVAHLRSFADSRSLADKLNKIKELYDPIGLAGKVLFLEMIKDTLPELPEDHFDELVLYETYVEVSLKRKIELLRDPGARLSDRELLDQLYMLLEKIAVAIHNSGEGSVDLKEFAAESGGAARLLWQASQMDEADFGYEDDAATRIGGRSLLRHVFPEADQTEEGWYVDFFHRSMKEYFVAKALKRALTEPDAFAATRELLIRTPMQPEIVGFFALLASSIDRVQSTLESLAHSARVGSEQGVLGGGSISLFAAAGGQMRGSNWQSLDLNGAFLVRANLSYANLRSSLLRGADLSLVDFTGTDLREADLTDANLDAGGTIIALAPDVNPSRYLCLTEESQLGRIAALPDGSLNFSFVPGSPSLRWPEGLYVLQEDIVLILAHAEFIVMDIGGEVAEEIARFRVSNNIHNVAIVEKEFIGLLLEVGTWETEAILLEIETGRVMWRLTVPHRPGIYGWYADGILIADDMALQVYRSNGQVDLLDAGLHASGRSVAVCDNIAMIGSNNGLIARLSIDDLSITGIMGMHNCACSAVVFVGADVVSAGTDGSISRTRCVTAGSPEVVARLERRLLCSGAVVSGLRGSREQSIFLANGAHSD